MPKATILFVLFIIMLTMQIFPGQAPVKVNLNVFVVVRNMRLV